PKRALRQAIKKSNLEIKGLFHITRHTAGSWWLQGTNLNGEKVLPVRMELIKELLGHSSIMITERVYAKLSHNNILTSLTFDKKV
ncbi:MAG: hypothetical protein LBQ13_01790, partial [Endomicrobium sp.]|nr:hypothetical protein [Endomicrobium sp.]